jgi:HEPN domain-containing protein
MADQFTDDLKRLLKLFQDTWADRAAFRIKEGIEASGHRADWEVVCQTAQTSAEELFQPALLELDNDVPVTHVLEQLLERLEKSTR